MSGCFLCGEMLRPRHGPVLPGAWPWVFMMKHMNFEPCLNELRAPPQQNFLVYQYFITKSLFNYFILDFIGKMFVETYPVNK